MCLFKVFHIMYFPLFLIFVYNDKVGKLNMFNLAFSVTTVLSVNINHT